MLFNSKESRGLFKVLDALDDLDDGKCAYVDITAEIE